MRKLIGLFLSLFGLPSIAIASCGGTDLLAALATENPAAHREIARLAAQVPNGEGLFWRVDRPGAAPSYLYGTFHDTEVAADPIDPRLLAALTEARVLLVEVTDEQQAEMQRRIATDPAFTMDLDGPPLSARIPPGDRAAAEAALAGRGLSLAQLDRLRPAFLMSILAQPQCALEAMAAGKPVLDAVLAARAEAAGVPTLGMETYEQALASIDALAPATLDRLLTDALLNLDKLKDFRRTSVVLYRKRAIGMMQEFEIWTGAEALGAAESRRLYSEFAAELLEGRNRLWMATMVPEIERGGAIAVFGALHLPGDGGVIELLRQRGFTVTRLDG